MLFWKNNTNFKLQNQSEETKYRKNLAYVEFFVKKKKKILNKKNKDKYKQ